MGWSKANLWDSAESKTIANQIATFGGAYCGPTAVVWIAAVWNNHKGRPYDYLTRIQDKKLFPNGPRRFFGNAPGMEDSLNVILKRETDNELKLTSKTYYRFGTIHDTLERFDMPIIIRMFPNLFGSLVETVAGPLPVDVNGGGLHYVTLYKSHKKNRRCKRDLVKFYWQDNGVYGNLNGGNAGLYGTAYRKIGLFGSFFWGAKRVEEV